jgi:hypothetical protein
MADDLGRESITTEDHGFRRHAHSFPETLRVSLSRRRMSAGPHLADPQRFAHVGREFDINPATGGSSF